MKRLPVFFLILLFLPALAAEKMTSVTIDGTSYTGIQDAHLVSGGRVVILYESGGTTVTPDKLPKAFLDSWGIKMDQVERSKEAAQKQAAQSLDEAILAGYFREVEGIVYDMRKPQAGWTHFVGAKIIKVAGDGALIEPNPGSGTNIFVRNLPHGLTDDGQIDVMARVSGSFTYVVSTQRGDFEHTIRAYDVGRICMRSEIPDAILKQGAAAAALPNAPKPRSFEVTSLPDSGRLRAIGSGFFVTRDGYLLTNFHVVKEANTVKVKYGSRIFKASVIETDEDNDLALLKVDGETFPALAIADKDSADLGQDVFTIGFPNIEMQGLQPKFTDGKISSLSGMQDNPKEYQVSVPVQPGNSGGPLCDSNGEVVGIIVARLNDMAVMQLQGVVPQNVNYAIKGRLARQMLQGAKGVTPIAPHGKKASDPIKSVESAIAMILIY